ncbi:ABC transporter ATP-binding protein [Burkholderia ubonensis]|uniref:Peptide ABC transporter ATP-binding protein n=1 Tax=Burkholderia ubonensis subsp. mesacidophila TaxID=265293 RepID=A0A2A4FFM0_9BURK|nr:ABC transporter ATP-binding protein [Burkholderia ubonensis]PCE31236.1 peptide ABC transporter ATP-binding protein [Burkholderia ubonensis subsp. mesacidophila]
MRELIVEDLSVTYPTLRGDVDVVQHLSMRIGCERVGIVGESGSGKSMTARALMGLVRAPGRVRAARLEFGGQDLLGLSERGWRRLRGSGIGLVLQDPKYSLNPVRRIGEQVAEAGLLHRAFGKGDARAKVLALLAEVGVADPERVAGAYPHQLSGGIGQRAMIAAMLAASPQLLIADEPTSALDVQVRDQVLALLSREIDTRRMGLLLISHDLRMVARFCDRVLIMYRGRVVEECRGDRLFDARHPYTRGLLDCLPSAATRGTTLPVLDRARLDGARDVLSANGS